LTQICVETTQQGILIIEKFAYINNLKKMMQMSIRSWFLLQTQKALN